MRNRYSSIGLVSVFAFAPAMATGANENENTKRIRVSAEVFDEMMGAPDKGVDRDLLRKAECVGIVPDMKRVAFVAGAKYGKGVLVCREASGRWSGPSVIRIEGGSFGFQIGAGETDLLFLVMNRHGEEKLMADKFTIGGDASAMAGPLGRTAEAQTDALMRAEILAWSRSRGVYAGISLEGATLRPDRDDNWRLYGHAVTQREILTGRASRPPGTGILYSALERQGARIARR